MEINGDRIKLYLYKHTLGLEGSTEEDEIKYHIIREFLIADDSMLEVGPSYEDKEIIVDKSRIYYQILSVMDQPVLEKYDTYSDYEYHIVRNILLFVPSNPNELSEQLATTAFTDKIKNKDLYLGILFQDLFQTIRQYAYHGMATVVMFAVLSTIYFTIKEYLKSGQLYNDVKSSTDFAYQNMVRPILTSTISEESLSMIETIVYAIVAAIETSLNVSYLLEQIGWLREQLYLQLVNNPVVPAITHLFETRVNEALTEDVPEQVVNQLVEQAPADTLQRLLYWFQVFQS